MRSRLLGLFLYLALVPQLVPFGSYAASPANSDTDHEFLMCGGSSFLHSEAYRNAMEKYGISVEKTPEDSPPSGVRMSTGRIAP